MLGMKPLHRFKKPRKARPGIITEVKFECLLPMLHGSAWVLLDRSCGRNRQVPFRWPLWWIHPVSFWIKGNIEYSSSEGINKVSDGLSVEISIAEARIFPNNIDRLSASTYISIRQGLVLAFVREVCSRRLYKHQLGHWEIWSITALLKFIRRPQSGQHRSRCLRE